MLGGRSFLIILHGSLRLLNSQNHDVITDGMAAPAVTVIIPSYNPGGLLRESIDSVFRQTCDDWRIVLVDDASTDGSLETLQDRLQDPRVTALTNEVNLGQSGSLNIALNQVRSKFFLQLDADDWLEDHAIQTFLRAAAAASDDVALILSNVIEVNSETGQQRVVRRPEWGKTYANRYQILLANLFPWQKFYRTAAIREVGGWPTTGASLWRNVEDLAIFLRLIEKYRFEWIDEALYNYRIHGSNITGDKEKTAAGVEWLIRDALERWGGRYKPLFRTTPEGWKLLAGLISD